MVSSWTKILELGQRPVTRSQGSTTPAY